MLVAACGDGAEHAASSASDARVRDVVRSLDASAAARKGEGGAEASSTDASSTPDASTTRDASTTPDASCGDSYVVHGAACATPGATATGPAPECGDVHYDCPPPATCSCVADKWSCPRCPRCTIDLAHPRLDLGGGIQLCEGATLTQCDGTTREVSGACSYRGTSLWCAAEDNIPIGCADAGRARVRDAGRDGSAP